MPREDCGCRDNKSLFITVGEPPQKSQAHTLYAQHMSAKIILYIDLFLLHNKMIQGKT